MYGLWMDVGPRVAALFVLGCGAGVLRWAIVKYLLQGKGEPPPTWGSR